MIPDTVLRSEQVIASPVPGVTITGIEYIGDDLHIQAYYENIIEMDNHG